MDRNFLAVGQAFEHQGKRFTVARVVQSKKTGQVAYITAASQRFLAKDCQPVDEFDRPLNESERATVVLVVEAMIAADCYELDLLEALGAEQKRQLWQTLSPEQREALKRAKAARFPNASLKKTPAKTPQNPGTISVPSRR